MREFSCGCLRFGEVHQRTPARPAIASSWKNKTPGMRRKTGADVRLHLKADVGDQRPSEQTTSHPAHARQPPCALRQDAPSVLSVSQSAPCCARAK